MTEDTTERSELLFTGPRGYACDLAQTDDGWAMAYVSMDAIDDRFVSRIGRMDVDFLSDADARGWSHALASARRRVHLVTGDAGKVAETELSDAPRVSAPAVSGGRHPAVAWCELHGDEWRLLIHHTDGERRTLDHGPHPFRHPALAAASEGRVWAACESCADGAVNVFPPDPDARTFKLEGRRPRLVAIDSDRAAVAYERHDPAGSRVHLALLSPGGVRDLELPSPCPLHFNADVILADYGQLLIVYTASPPWGPDARLDLHRELMLVQVDPVWGRILEGPGTAEGFLPVHPMGFDDGTVQNVVPLNPRLVWHNGQPVCMYRAFRFGGSKSFGWQLNGLFFDGRHWSEPCRLVPEIGFQDTPYGVIPLGDRLLAALHCCLHEPNLPFARAAHGLPAAQSHRATDHHVEVRLLPDAGTAPGADDVEFEWVPAAVSEPVRLPLCKSDTPSREVDDLRLVWANLHMHTGHSKCMSARDGSPEEVLFYQRHVLGNEVVCLTDHVEYMSDIEFSHVMDALESMAQERVVPLYAVEWARLPAHHTNFFCAERRIMERLRAILLSEKHLTDVFGRMREELPPDSVAAIRHFHGFSDGRHGVRSPHAPETFDPQFEWAMEAAQLRGDMMVTPPGNAPLFPTNFLNAGAKIGLVGGSDHARSRPAGICLTGLWVKELTASAVLDALKQRRTVTTIGGKLPLWVECEGGAMGASGNATLPVDFRLSLPPDAPLRSLRMMRSGEWLEPVIVRDDSGTKTLRDEHAVPGNHFYVFRIESDFGPHRETITAYTSPIWLTV